MDYEDWSDHLLCGTPYLWEGFLQMIKDDNSSEDASARAERLTEALRGLLKEELSEHGGAEAFVRLIRSDKDAADGR